MPQTCVTKHSESSLEPRQASRSRKTETDEDEDDDHLNHDDLDEVNRDSCTDNKDLPSRGRPVIPKDPLDRIVPHRNRDYESREYWEERFAIETQYEWLLSFEQLQPQLVPLLEGLNSLHDEITTTDEDQATNGSSPSPRILVVGCGNSPFSADLYDAGYHSILNIDYSEIVITSMSRQHQELRPQMEWHVMNMTKLSALPDASFDMVIDKAAMDTLLTNEGDVWNPNDTAIAAARSMCSHISRILKPNGGLYIQISLIQPHFRSKYLLGLHHARETTGPVCASTTATAFSAATTASRNTTTDRVSTLPYSDEFGWTLRVESAGVTPSDDAVAGGRPTSSSFGYFLYILEKRDHPPS